MNGGRGANYEYVPQRRKGAKKRHKVRKNGRGHGLRELRGTAWAKSPSYETNDPPRPNEIVTGVMSG